ncbi:hypothetical protein BC832DRAFT_157348 [Gaertneriomyces semiglobifer]|nr:hypothetical protein BC832DRAFT_157348 [Gaertneriomyces semiglobifer]
MIVRPRVQDNAQFPPTLPTISGQTIDLVQLSSDKHVVAILLKAPWCQVCPVLLTLLSFLGLDTSITTLEWTDPLTDRVRSVTPIERRYNRLLLCHDTYFIVICPGGPESLRRIQQESEWDRLENVAFVADTNMELAEVLGLRIGEGVWPSILNVKEDLSIETIEIGRSAGYYGDKYLLRYLGRRRHTIEALAAITVKQTTIVLSRLQKRTSKHIYYNHPSKDKLPLELLSDILSLTIGLSDPHSFVQIGKTCRSWKYVALSTSIEMLSERLKGVTKMIPMRRADCVENADDDEGAYVPVLVLERAVKDLQMVREWVLRVFEGFGIEVPIIV